MTSDRKKPGLAFWATVAVVVVLLYVASFGPACWITSQLNRGARLIPVVYRPLTWAMSVGSIHRISRWYAKLGAPDDWELGFAYDAANRPIGWVWVSFDHPTNDIW